MASKNTKNKTTKSSEKKALSPSKIRQAQLREKWLQNGFSSFEVSELLEMMLFYCYPSKDTSLIAKKMLDFYGSLNILVDADTKDLQHRCDITERVSVFFPLLSEMVKRCDLEKWKGVVLFDSVELFGNYAVSLLAHEKQECFYAILLNQQHQLIDTILVSRGTVDQTSVYVRDVVEIALNYNARNVVFAHNHPGGSLKPSKGDIATTIRLAKGLNSIYVSITDHIIVAENKYVSMAALGLVQNNFESIQI